MLPLDDFSTNRYFGTNDSPSKPQVELPLPSHHPDLCFNDGNLAILTGGHYFLVHQGLLCRHSIVLSSVVKALEGKQARFLEGRLVLELEDGSDDVYYFLLALYDGISALKFDLNDFSVVAAILKLSTKYQVKHLRMELIRGLSSTWPKTLPQWEIREAKATSMSGVYEPRKTIPHPILVINLARASDTPELLPAAYYDLSRSSPSDCAAGYVCPLTSKTHQLSDHDLLCLLRGKEHASRFLSTFIVNELEGRDPSASCINQLEIDGSRRRVCQTAFEAITFEILRDVNGVVCHRSSDPLFAIMDAELMQTREDSSGRASTVLRACEFCRSEFGAAVDAAREEFWLRLPQWFGVDLQSWT